MDRTTTNRGLARRLGVSETAVRRAEKAGRIGREADGSWDLARVRAAWAGNTDPAQQRRKPGGRERRRAARGAAKPVPEAAVGAVRETLREHGEPVAAGAMTFMQARTANEVLKAQERRVRLQRMKDELVDRAKAVAQVFRLARDERDAWVNWAGAGGGDDRGRARHGPASGAHRARASCPRSPRRAGGGAPEPALTRSVGRPWATGGSRCGNYAR